MKRLNFLNLLGFTLSEVLITLGVIGVVATMAIPALLNNMQDAQYKTAYKKAFSIAAQALTKANSEGDIIYHDSTYTGDPATEEIFINFVSFMNQYNVIKKCISSDNSKCWASKGELYGKNYSLGRPLEALYAFIDDSGCAWTMLEAPHSRIAVDTNGFNLPNQYGKDRFALHLWGVENSDYSGLPIKIVPYIDNDIEICTDNVCGAKSNYYGTTWLYK